MDNAGVPLLSPKRLLIATAVDTAAVNSIIITAVLRRIFCHYDVIRFPMYNTIMGTGIISRKGATTLRKNRK